MSLYTNNVDVSISEMARLTFHEVINGERFPVAEIVMGVALLESLAETINKTIAKHKEAIRK